MTTEEQIATLEKALTKIRRMVKDAVSVFVMVEAAVEDQGRLRTGIFCTSCRRRIGWLDEPRDATTRTLTQMELPI